jgi:hypothetical protein
MQGGQRHVAQIAIAAEQTVAEWGSSARALPQGT